MQSFEEFAAWVKGEGGQKGLAAAFKKKLGIKIGQPAISGWLTKKKIPIGRRRQLEKLGWTGPWEWVKTDEVAESHSSYVTGALPDRRAHVRQASRMLLNGIKERGLDGLLTEVEENQMIDGLADGISTERPPGEIEERLQFLLDLAAKALRKELR